MAKAITRMHKLLITEQYVLEFMRQQKPHKPAYEYTLQDFFTYIARQQDKEELKKENRVPQEYSPERKKQKFLTEQQKTEVMSKYIQKEKKR